MEIHIFVDEKQVHQDCLALGATSCGTMVCTTTSVSSIIRSFEHFYYRMLKL